MALHSISICTGVGGLELAVDIAFPGMFRPVLYVEREISVAEILAARIEEEALPAAPIWSDVKTLCSPEVRAYIRRATGDSGIGLLTAGYPCQPFSCAGKRRGREDPRHLWPWIVDAIGEYRPAVVWFENVPGHLICGFGDVRRDLEARGYRVQAGLFSAAEVGAPHRRVRLFILGVDDSEGFGRRIRDSKGRISDANIVRRSPAMEHSGWNGRRDSLSGRRSEGRAAVSRTSEQFPVRCVECGKRHATGSLWCGFECAAVWLAANCTADQISEFKRQRGGPVDNSAGPRREETQRRADERGAAELRRECLPAYRGNGLADADGRPVPKHDVRIPTGRGIAGICEQSVGNSKRNGLGASGRKTAGVADEGYSVIPEWPPGRNDADSWRSVLDAAPWLAPAITETEAQSRFRGVADGIPEGLDREIARQWNDRLRACGNGVVPLSAAAAFIQLFAAHFAEIEMTE